MEQTEPANTMDEASQGESSGASHGEDYTFDLPDMNQIARNRDIVEREMQNLAVKLLVQDKKRRKQSKQNKEEVIELNKKVKRTFAKIPFEKRVQGKELVMSLGSISEASDEDEGSNRLGSFSSLASKSRQMLKYIHPIISFLHPSIGRRLRSKSSKVPNSNSDYFRVGRGNSKAQDSSEEHKSGKIYRLNL